MPVAYKPHLRVAASMTLDRKEGLWSLYPGDKIVGKWTVPWVMIPCVTMIFFHLEFHYLPGLNGWCLLVVVVGWCWWLLQWRSNVASARAAQLSVMLRLTQVTNPRSPQVACGSGVQSHAA
jgi:hypothetical protein